MMDINEHNEQGNDNESAAIAPEELRALRERVGPSEEDAQAEQVEPETDAKVQAVAEMIFPAFHLGHKNLCPEWGIKAQQEQMLAESTAKTILRYYPDFDAELPPWAELALAAVIVYAPHLGKPRHKEPEKEVKGSHEKSES